ncbi:transmembrane protein 213-like [Scyliorhinus torazame]|uniref:Uncharacterized protein n=1 Tax=Scyliorhinus torazame TaxID=75743 RepID=A0A401Q1Q3_SCYTO|nr:hypothetical protein [Scyliorhinus torazame]
MDLKSVSCCVPIAVCLVLVGVDWASATVEQVVTSLDSNFTLTESRKHSVDQCEQYLQNGQDICAIAKTCCQLGVDEYGWIAAAVGWSFWFLTIILICVNKVGKLRPEESEKYPAP